MLSQLRTLIANMKEMARREQDTLAEANRTLELRVQERTSQLSQANEQLTQEMQTRSKMEIELRHAQKLESVGRLAAGIAHEINTPIQFVGDNVTFLQLGFTDLLALCKFYRGLCDKAAAPDAGARELARVAAGRGDRRPGLPARERAPVDRRHPGRHRAGGQHRAGHEELRPPRPGREEPPPT